METPENLGLFYAREERTDMGLYKCWCCFLPAFVFHLYSFFLPIIPTPSTVSSFCPLYLLYLPAGPAPHSSPSTALPSTTEAASCGLQDGAARRQMSWQGRSWKTGGDSLQMSPARNLAAIFYQASAEGVQIKIS